jgi:trigger factor
VCEVELLEKDKIKFIFKIIPENLDSAVDKVYNKKKSSITISGFRKGKATRAMIEMRYGQSYFYFDAINLILSDEFDRALNEYNKKNFDQIDYISKPEFNIESIQGRDVTVSAILTLKPKIKIGDYKNIEIEIEIKDEELKAKIREEQLISLINTEREKNARLINKENEPAKMNDIVTLNCEGRLDGVIFPEGNASNYDLVLGSRAFVSDFEDQLVGKKAGDECKVNIKFPDSYHHKHLAGKSAVFDVDIIKVTKKILPDIDDDFAMEISEFDTLDDYKKDLIEKLETQEKEKSKKDKEQKVINKLIEITEVEISEDIVNKICELKLDEFKTHAQRNGYSVEDYYAYSGLNEDKMLKAFREDAVRDTKLRLALEYISKAENVEVSQEEIDKEINKISQIYKIDRERVLKILNKGDDIKVQKALDLVCDLAKTKEKNDVNIQE